MHDIQMSVSQKFSLKLISVYRAATVNRHRLCRFEPTCSAYASEALEEYGFWKGWGYALRRLSRCRPGGGWGYDPVPTRGEQSKAGQACGHAENGQPDSDSSKALQGVPQSDIPNPENTQPDLGRSKGRSLTAHS